MASWYETARQHIAEVSEGFPKDMPFKERKKAIYDAYPFGTRSHFPYKAWCKAQREYLAKYDPRPAGPLHAAMMESPLEKIKRKSENHDALMRICGRIT